MSDTEKPTRSTGGRLYSLDILRALAVVLVMGRHAHLKWVSESPMLRPFAEIWHKGGWMGVDLFFVLSGFLVSGLLFSEYRRHKQIRIGNFLARRGLKIYPAFYVMIAATVFYQGLAGGKQLPNLVCELLFVQNYGPSLWNHTWSLAVEEHFYLLIALLTLVLYRLSKGQGNPYRFIPRIFVIVAALALAARIVTAFKLPFHPVTHMFATHLRIDSLMFGVMLSYFYHFHRDRFLGLCRQFRWPLLVIGVLLIMPTFVIPLGRGRFLQTWGFTSIYIGSGLVMLAMLVARLPANLLVRAVAKIGSYSYSIYLWHMPVQRWLMPKFLQWGITTPESPLNYPIYVAACIIGGMLLAWLVEMPVLHLRDRFVPSRSRALEPNGNGDGAADAATEQGQSTA